MKARYPGACTPRRRKGSAEREGHDGAPTGGNPPVYFAPGDLVFAGRPRDCHRRLAAAAADGACTCVRTFGARRSMAGGRDLIWNRGSKLIGCEVQGTLAPYVEEPNKTENVVTFDQTSFSSFSSSSCSTLRLVSFFSRRVDLALGRAGSMPGIRLLFRA